MQNNPTFPAAMFASVAVTHSELMGVETVPSMALFITLHYVHLSPVFFSFFFFQGASTLLSKMSLHSV